MSGRKTGHATNGRGSVFMFIYVLIEFPLPVTIQHGICSTTHGYVKNFTIVYVYPVCLIKNHSSLSHTKSLQNLLLAMMVFITG